MNPADNVDMVEIEQGKCAYFSKRKETDIDLVNAVLTALMIGKTQEEISVITAIYNSDNLVKSAYDKIPSVQRWLLNSYWSNQFSKLTDDTRTERFNLIAEGSEKDWLQRFMRHVLPSVNKYGLPKA